MMKKSSQGAEPVLTAYLAKQSTLLDKLDGMISKLYPIQMIRPDLNWTLDSLALMVASPEFRDFQIKKIRAGETVTQQEVTQSLHKRQVFKKSIKDGLFAPSQRRPRLQSNDTNASSRQSSGIKTFAEQLPDSLLPDVVKLAHTHKINLVFIQVKRRPNPDESSIVTPWEQQYTDALKKYVTEQGFGFHDFNGDPEIKAKHFWDDSHIEYEYMPFYTRHFVSTLPQYFK